ncbi:MAG: hypothetical protein H6719_08340 [Sandaracinaceae bacterium]|nr:hypothetical protein [Sandaracinaceae bacterium]
MTRREPPPARGLPGGIAPPAIGFVACAVFFGYTFSHPRVIDLGPHMSPAGIGILGGVVTLGWLLVAIGKRRPPGSER